MTTALVATLAGLLGIGLGAWLNSLFATRKERWEFKRSIYCQLLEHLHEAAIVLETMARTRDRELSPQFAAAVVEIRRARAVAALILDRGTSLALDDLDRRWTSVRDATDEEGATRAKQGSEILTATYDAVLRIARRDLGLKLSDSEWSSPA